MFFVFSSYCRSRSKIPLYIILKARFISFPNRLPVFTKVKNSNMDTRSTERSHKRRGNAENALYTSLFQVRDSQGNPVR